ncbi:MAG: host attachment family protein [Erythrobacter sp.]
MKIATGTLVLALDGSKMQLFRNQGDTRSPVLQLLASEKNENPRSSSQGSDRPGRSFSSASPRRSAMSETDLHEQAERDFARSAIKILDQYKSNAGAGVIVLAAPRVLGEFRECCPDRLKSEILAEIDKDVVNHTPEQIVSIVASAGA